MYWFRGRRAGGVCPRNAAWGTRSRGIARHHVTGLPLPPLPPPNVACADPCPGRRLGRPHCAVGWPSDWRWPARPGLHRPRPGVQTGL
eukprot:scaffold49905_cov343-Isochrysis_galbana.AAC.2